MSRKAELMPVETQSIKAAEPAATSILSVIERAARSADVDVDKMERLFALQERFLAKEAETAFNAAMNQAQAKIGRIATDAVNDQTDSRYATYAALDRVIRPIYIEAGLSLSFDTAESPLPEHVRVLCYVSHTAGHTRTYQIDMPADGKGAKGGAVMTKTHATGSAAQYGMRYLVKGIFNIAIGRDDDGNAAGGDPECIGPGQIADLEALISEVGASLPMFLRYCKVESIDQIKVKNYKAAVAALVAKRK